jgi:hypothetical protein
MSHSCHTARMKSTFLVKSRLPFMRCTAQKIAPFCLGTLQPRKLPINGAVPVVSPWLLAGPQCRPCMLLILVAASEKEFVVVGARRSRRNRPSRRRSKVALCVFVVPTSSSSSKRNPRHPSGALWVSIPSSTKGGRPVSAVTPKALTLCHLNSARTRILSL